MWDTFSRDSGSWAVDSLKPFMTPSYDAQEKETIFFYFFLRHRRCNVCNGAKHLHHISCSRFFHLPAQRFVRHMRRPSSQFHATLALLVTYCDSPLYTIVTLCHILVLRLFGTRYPVISNALNLPAQALSFVPASLQEYRPKRHPAFVIYSLPIFAIRFHGASVVKYNVYLHEINARLPPLTFVLVNFNAHSAFEPSHVKHVPWLICLTILWYICQYATLYLAQIHWKNVLPSPCPQVKRVWILVIVEPSEQWHTTASKTQLGHHRSATLLLLFTAVCDDPNVLFHIIIPN